MPELTTLKDRLKKKGWTYRTAAQYLGVGFTYLSDVLNGHRSSIRLCKRIGQMPDAVSVAKANLLKTTEAAMKYCVNQDTHRHD